MFEDIIKVKTLELKYCHYIMFYNKTCNNNKKQTIIYCNAFMLKNASDFHLTNVFFFFFYTNLMPLSTKPPTSLSSSSSLFRGLEHTKIIHYPSIQPASQPSIHPSAVTFKYLYIYKNFYDIFIFLFHSESSLLFIQRYFVGHVSQKGSRLHLTLLVLTKCFLYFVSFLLLLLLFLLLDSFFITFIFYYFVFL